MKQISRKFTIINEKGLHARAAALIVTAAGRYDSTIVLFHDEMKAECDSILSVLTLACPKHSEIMVEAIGADAEQAMEEISHLIESGFGEDRE